MVTRKWSAFICAVDILCKNYQFKPPNSKGTVFSFLGCYWHGCIDCQTSNSLKLQEHYNAKHQYDKKFNSEGKIISKKFQTLEQFEEKYTENRARGISSNQNYQSTRLQNWPESNL